MVEEGLLQTLHAGEVQDDWSEQDGCVYTDVHHALARLAQGCFAVVIEHPGTGDLRMKPADSRQNLQLSLESADVWSFCHVLPVLPICCTTDRFTICQWRKIVNIIPQQAGYMYNLFHGFALVVKNTESAWLHAVLFHDKPLEITDRKEFLHITVYCVHSGRSKITLGLRVQFNTPRLPSSKFSPGYPDGEDAAGLPPAKTPVIVGASATVVHKLWP